MFVKIHHNEIYLGTKHKAGAVIEVADDLGDRMISAGKATKAAKPVDEVTAEFIDAMDLGDIKERVAKLEIKTADNKKPTLVAALKAHYGV